MDKSQWKVSRGFAVFLLGSFLLWLIAELLFPENHRKAQAMILKTRSDERLVSFVLGERASEVGGLTNIHSIFILDSLFATKQNQIWLSTNVAGELVDIWQTPYQIELVGRTNFVVRSAGKDKKFGTKDDIVFNSVSNDFVKP